MEGIFNSIKNFITVELDPLVRVLIIGLLLIAGLLFLRNVIKEYVNAKSYSSVKIGSIIFTIIFIGLAVFVAVI